MKVGALCLEDNVRITRGPNVQSAKPETTGKRPFVAQASGQASVSVTGLASGEMFLDERCGYVYIGGAPLAVFMVGKEWSFIGTSAELVADPITGAIVGIGALGDRLVVVMVNDTASNSSVTILSFPRCNLTDRYNWGAMIEAGLYSNGFPIGTGGGLLTVPRVRLAVFEEDGYLVGALLMDSPDSRVVVRLETTVQLTKGSSWLLVSFWIDVGDVFSAARQLVVVNDIIVIVGSNLIGQAEARSYHLNGSIGQSFLPVVCGSDGSACLSVEEVANVGLKLFLFVIYQGGVDIATLDADNLQFFIQRPAVTGLLNDFTITATAINSASGLGYFCLNTVSNPSTLYKFTLAGLAVNGLNNFINIGFESEVIASLLINQTQNIMYGLTTLTQLQIVTVSLYSVQQIAPNIADAEGGTPIHIIGEGYIDSQDTPVCRFASAIPGSADLTVVGTWYIGSSGRLEIVCIAPRTEGSDGQKCAGQLMDIALKRGGESLKFTNNQIMLRRPTSPVPKETSPTYGHFATQQLIQISGERFTPSAFLTCKFTDGVTTITSTIARVLGTQSAECVQPVMKAPLLSPAFVEVSLDGHVYSEYRLPYTVVGDGARLATEIGAEGIEVGFEDIESYGNASDTLYILKNQSIDVYVFSSLEVLIAPIYVYVVDTLGRRVLKTSGARGEVALSVNGSSRICNSSSTKSPLFDGVAVFRSICLQLPLADVYSFEFAFGKWRSLDLTVHVLAGAPASLQLKRQPSDVSAQLLQVSTRLERQPVLILLDAAGNTVTRIGNYDGISVKGYFVPNSFGVGTIPLANSSNAVRATVNGGVLLFDFESQPFALNGRRGWIYSIEFVAFDAAGIYTSIKGVQSDPIAVPPCTDVIGTVNTRYFYYNGSTTCRDCPVGGICNGSDVVIPEVGYWKGPTSAKPHLCQTKELCLRGGCRRGTEGVMCSKCQSGYGGTTCGRCPSRIVSIVQLIFTLLAVGMGIAFVLMMNLRKNTKKKDPLGIGLKMLLNHLQVSSRIGNLRIILPPVLIGLFNVQSNGSDIKMSNSPLQCLFPGFDTYSEFWMYVLFPVCLLPVLVVVPIIFWISRKLEAKKATEVNMIDMHIAAFNRAMQQQIIVTKKYKHLYGLAFVIVIYFTYPTLVNACGRMLLCTTVIVGQNVKILESSDLVEDISMDYLAASPYIDCNSEKYNTYRKLASFLLSIYGITVPIAIVFIVRISRKLLGRETSDLIFLFFLSGYKESMWFWEAVNVSKKFVIVCVTVFITDPTLQTYIGMWVMLVILALQYSLSPFDNSLYNILECSSIGVISITLNLCLLFPYFLSEADKESNRDFTTAAVQNIGGYYALTIFILVINIAVILVFVAIMVLGIRQKINRFTTLKEVRSMLEADFAWMGEKAFRFFRVKNNLYRYLPPKFQMIDESHSGQTIDSAELTTMQYLRTLRAHQKQKFTEHTKKSGRQVYLSYCKQAKCRPKREILNSLPREVGDFNMVAYHAPIGFKWSGAVTPPLTNTLRHFPLLRELCFDGCGLNVEVLLDIIEFAHSHESVTELDFSNNLNVNNDVGSMVVDLVQHSHRITRVETDNCTNLSPDLRSYIEALCQANLLRCNGGAGGVGLPSAMPTRAPETHKGPREGAARARIFADVDDLDLLEIVTQGKSHDI